MPAGVGTMRFSPSRRVLDAAVVGFGTLTLVLVIVNGGLFLANQSSQSEINGRQQFINQSIQLGRLNESLIRALATAAATGKDDKLRQMLADHGINFTYTPNPPAPSQPGKN